MVAFFSFILISSFPIATDGYDHCLCSVASDGTDYLVTWEYDIDDDRTWRLFCQKVSNAGSLIGDEQRICTGEWTQCAARPAYGSGLYHIVWQDLRSGYATIWGRKAGLDGIPYGDDFAISPGSVIESEPAISWGTLYFLVTWSASISGWAQLHGQRVNPDGTLPGSEIVISAGSHHHHYSAVSFGDTRWMVVWVQGTGSASDHNIYGQRLNMDGTLVGSEISISTTVQNECAVAICWTGTRWLVIWFEGQSGAGTNGKVYGQLVNSDGSLYGSAITICGTPTAASYYGWGPAIAWQDTLALVVWPDARSGVRNIYGQYVKDDGSLSGENFIISYSPNLQQRPGVNSNGSNFLVVYEQYDQTGNWEWHDIYGEIITPGVGITENRKSEIGNPKLTVSPNPFREKLRIAYSLGRNAKNINLKIYDAAGRFVKDFSRATPDALRPTQITWDGTDDAGEKVPSGIYFAELKASNGVREAKKIILLR